MNAEDLKEGEEYIYKSAYNNGFWEVFKCLKVYFNEAQDQWKAKFEVVSDYPSNATRKGQIERFNEIEIERYVYPKNNEA